MSEVRCPACRGRKEMPKLGGIVGECNTCKGTGKIKAIDKPVPFVPEVAPVINEVVKAVADVVAISEPVVKVDAKKAVFRRKTTAK